VWLAIAREHGLTGFAMNRPHVLDDGTQIRIDVYFPAARLAVEIDDRSHLTPEAQRRDAHRDRRLALEGILCVRYPVADLAASGPDLARLLRARASR
jgi:very-short-patch-repair endonuclease